MGLNFSYDNQGSPSLGTLEWTVGGTWADIGGLGHALSYQLTRSFTGLYASHALTYTAPLPWLDKLTISGTFSAEQAIAGPDAQKMGHSDQVSLRYLHNFLPHEFSAKVSLSQDIQIGYDFKPNDDNLLENGDQVFQSIEIDQFPLIYDATLTDPWGQTVLQNTLVLSPGGLTNANSTQTFRKVISGSSARYVYDNINLTRTTNLPADFSWVVRAQAQVVSTTLMYTEQLALGGAKTVRGYAASAAGGSQGLLVTNEVWAPALDLGKRAAWGLPFQDAEQIGLFLDYGEASQPHPIPGVVNHAVLASVGPALHVTADRFFDLTYDAGWQLRAAPGTTRRGVFCDVLLTAGFLESTTGMASARRPRDWRCHLVNSRSTIKK